MNLILGFIFGITVTFLLCKKTSPFVPFTVNVIENEQIVHSQVIRYEDDLKFNNGTFPTKYYLNFEVMQRSE